MGDKDGFFPGHFPDIRHHFAHGCGNAGPVKGIGVGGHLTEELILSLGPIRELGALISIGARRPRVMEVGVPLPPRPLGILPGIAPQDWIQLASGQSVVRPEEIVAVPLHSGL